MQQSEQMPLFQKRLEIQKLRNSLVLTIEN